MDLVHRLLILNLLNPLNLQQPVLLEPLLLCLERCVDGSELALAPLPLALRAVVHVQELVVLASALDQGRHEDGAVEHVLDMSESSLEPSPLLELDELSVLLVSDPDVDEVRAHLFVGNDDLRGHCVRGGIDPDKEPDAACAV